MLNYRQKDGVLALAMMALFAACGGGVSESQNNDEGTSSGVAKAVAPPTPKERATAPAEDAPQKVTYPEDTTPEEDTSPTKGTPTRGVTSEARLGPMQPRIRILGATGASTSMNERVARVVLRHRVSLDKCLAEVEQPSRTLVGEVVISYSVNSEGEVVNSKIARNTVPATALAQCFSDAAETWTFHGIVHNAERFSVTIAVGAPAH